jgi:hypothetical protein
MGKLRDVFGCKWLDGNTETKAHWIELARQCIAGASSHPRVLDVSWDLADAPRYILSQWLDDEALPSWSGNLDSIYHDLLGSAWLRVNWWEIADRYLAAAKRLNRKRRVIFC